MAIEQFQKSFTGERVERPTAALIRFPAPFGGTIKTLDLWIAGAMAFGSAVFNLSINGDAKFSGGDRPTIATGDASASKTGLNFVVVKGDLIELDVISTGVAGIAAPVTFQVGIDDGAEVFTTENIQDMVGAMFQTGSRIIFNYNDATGKLEIDSVAPTNEEIQDAVAAALTNGSNVSIVYNDGANTITINSTDTTKTDEEIQDIVAGLLTQGSNVTLTYNDAGNSLTIAASGGGGGSSAIGVRVGKTISQSISSASWTTITYDSEVFDDSPFFHDNITNNSRLTVPTGQAGWYMITSQISWAADAAGQRGIRIMRNGSSSYIAHILIAPNQDGSVGTRMMTSTLYYLSATDYVETQVYQSNGSTLNVIGGGTETAFAMVKI